MELLKYFIPSGLYTSVLLYFSGPQIKDVLETYEQPKPLKIFHEYIDSIVFNKRGDEFYLYRLPNLGLASIYIIRKSSEESLMQLIDPIKIGRFDDRIIIEHKNKIYEWFPTKGIITGPDNDILYHFERKPRYITQ